MKHLAKALACAAMLFPAASHAELYFGGSVAQSSTDLERDNDFIENPGANQSFGYRHLNLGLYGGAVTDGGLFAEVEFYRQLLLSKDSGFADHNPTNRASHIGFRVGKTFGIGTLEAYYGLQQVNTADPSTPTSVKSETFGVIFGKSFGEKLSGSVYFGHTDNPENQALGGNNGRDSRQLRDFNQFGIRIDYQAFERVSFYFEGDKGTGVTHPRDDAASVERFALGAELKASDRATVYVEASDFRVEQRLNGLPNSNQNRASDTRSISIGLKFDFGSTSPRAAKRIAPQQKLLDWKGQSEGVLM